MKIIKRLLAICIAASLMLGFEGWQCPVYAAQIEEYSLPANQTWVESSLTSTSKVKYFKIVLPASGKLTVYYRSYFRGTNFILLNNELSKDFSSWNSSYSSSASNPSVKEYSTWLEAGTYYVKVSPNYSQYLGDFSLKALFTPANNTENEPNQTYEQAMPLYANTAVKGLLSRTDIYDYYKITVPDKATITFRAASYKDTTRIKIMNSSLATLYATSKYNGKEGDPEIISRSIECNQGTYYFMVYGGSTGLYEISYSEKKKVSGIKLNSKTKTLYKGKSITLYTSITPYDAANKGVTWKSSNTKVATVSSTGVVKPKAVGKAKITATTKDGSKKSASCTVSVKEPTLKVKSSSLNIKKGKKKKIVITSLKPKTTVKYKCSNTSIASISKSGEIKAKKKGKCKIYVTANGIKKTVKVTVQ